MQSATVVKDPVCGMDVDTATAVGHTNHEGQTYYFCGSICKEKFDRNPAQYLSAGLISIYRKRAKRYDRSAPLFYIAGFRHWAYRKRAIQSLGLHMGDTVVDIGCGTGLNFSLLQEQVGPDGRIIGIDLSDSMLAQASGRIEAHRWSNVELIQRDVATYIFPSELGGILSTFALTLVSERTFQRSDRPQET